MCHFYHDDFTWEFHGISNIQVRFQEFTLGIEDPQCFALDS